MSQEKLETVWITLLTALCFIVIVPLVLICDFICKPFIFLCDLFDSLINQISRLYIHKEDEREQKLRHLVEEEFRKFEDDIKFMELWRLGTRKELLNLQKNLRLLETKHRA
jgi:hypothetical protein